MNNEEVIQNNGIYMENLDDNSKNEKQQTGNYDSNSLDIWHFNVVPMCMFTTL